MKKIFNYFTILSIFLYLFSFGSCDNNIFSDSKSTNQLRQAEELAETNPEQAQTILNRIGKPETMSKQNYMEYIVTNTYVRYRLKEDITNETAIFEALKYLEDSNDPLLLARANFCVGWINYLNSRFEEGFINFRTAYNKSKESNEDIITVRSLNNIGHVYLEQERYDSAIVNFQHALDLNINAIDNFKFSKLVILTNIGYTYLLSDSLANAERYCNKALTIAKELNNNEFQARLYMNLGTIAFRYKKHKEAMGLYEKSLSYGVNKDDAFKTKVFLVSLLELIGEMDSADTYMNQIKQEITKIKDLYDLNYAYGVLSDYYKERSDLKKALEYSELKEKTTRQIAAKNQADKLQKAEQDLVLDQKRKEAQKELFYNNLYWAVSVVLIVGLAALLILLIIKEARKAHDMSMEEFKDRMFMLTHVRKERLRIESKDTNHYKEIMLRMMLIKKAKLAHSIKQEKETLAGKDMQAKTVWAKDFLSKQVCPKDLMEGLSDEHMLLLTLCFKGYKSSEISTILNQSISETELNIDRLRCSMLHIGSFSSEQIDRILDNTIHQ